MNDSKCAISLREVNRTFDDFVAVRDLSLNIADGEFFSLIGPSGCGKTTTLRMLAGLDSPTSGSIEVHGKDMVGVPPYRRPINTVFQNYALFPHLTVGENVAFGLRERKTERREMARRVGEILELVHLPGKEKRRPRELSGGQQQRVALARALVLKPEVLLLDEPLGALDLKLRRSMQGLMKEIQREVGITFVYVTHDQEEAFSMSSRIGIMNRGILEQVDTPQAVYRRPASAFVADFVGASNHVTVEVLSVAGTRYRVAAPTIGTVDCDGVDGIASGSTAAMVVRPELISIVDSGTGASLSGTIRDVSYNGPTVDYLVETGLGTFAIKTDGQRLASIDSSVGITWPASACWLVPMPSELSANETSEEATSA
ncbi:MAG: ABC transporter ATP-binding protein [Actinobacteria bacterium]|nr:ABC transporter ATP-binding protein [Actinomycetota bacterium]